MSHVGARNAPGAGEARTDIFIQLGTFPERTIAGLQRMASGFLEMLNFTT